MLPVLFIIEFILNLILENDYQVQMYQQSFLGASEKMTKLVLFKLAVIFQLDKQSVTLLDHGGWLVGCGVYPATHDSR